MQTYDIDTHEAEWNSPNRAQRLVENLVQEGSIVIDIGIGTGQAVEGYAEKGAKVIGIDKDADMLAAAQSAIGPMGEVRCSDINKPLPLGDLAGQADIVQAIGVLEFVDDLESLIDQIEHTLKANGAFVFTVETLSASNPGDKRIEVYEDTNITVYRHTAEEVRALLERKGLTLVYDEAYGGYIRDDMKTGKVPYHIFLACK